MDAGVPAGEAIHDSVAPVAVIFAVFSPVGAGQVTVHAVVVKFTVAE